MAYLRRVPRRGGLLCFLLALFGSTVSYGFVAWSETSDGADGALTPIKLLKVEPVKLAAGALKGKKIAHMTGTTQFKLDDAGRKEIKDFVTAGGTLIIDSTAGNGPFAESVETEMDAIFGADAKSLSEALPQDSPLYSAGGKPIEIAL